MPDALYPLADAYLLPAGYGAQVPANATRGQRVSGELLSEAGTLSNLTVRGQLSLLRSGALRAGQDGFDSGVGFFMDYNNGTPRFSLGDSNGKKLVWDGSELTVAGTMTVDSGKIGGWDVGAANLIGGDAELNSAGYLALGSGNNILRADASNATARLWIGHSNPALAPFRVSPTGQAVMANVAVTGGSIAGSTVGPGINGGNISAGTITGNAIQAGSITADKLSVSNLSAISANLGTITAGTINGGTVNANTIKTGSLQLAADGSVNGGASLLGTLGNIALANLTVTGQILLGPGGKIVDADGSEWNQSGIVLRTPSGATDTIQFRDSTNTVRGSMFASSVMGLYLSGTPAVYLDGGVGDVVILAEGAGSDIQIRGGRTIQIWSGSYNPPGHIAYFESNGYFRPGGRIYPGGPSGNQLHTYIQAPLWPAPYSSSGAFLDFHLAQDVGLGRPGAGYATLRVFNGSGQQVWGVNSQGVMGLIDGLLSSTPGNLVVKVPVSNRGTTKYIYLYDS